jgi:drug/metabolite transporter (DMT)-like permease
LGIHLGAWIISLSLTSVAASVLLVTTNPLWVGLLSPWLTKERLSWSVWGGIALSLVGAGIVALDNDSSKAASPALGNALALLGAVAASGYLLLGRRVRVHLDIGGYASATLFGAWLILFPMALFFKAPLYGFSWTIWLLLLSMALLPQMITHNAISWSLRYLRADIVALILLLEPVGASLLAWLWLNESLSPLVALGGVILLCGLAWVIWHEARQKGRASG